MLDAEEYGALAHGLFGGRWREATSGTYVHGMLYPFVWALVDSAGGGPLALRLLQAVLGAASCVLLYDVARRHLPSGAALLCGAVAAGYWPFVLFGSQLLAETLVLFLELALVWQLTRRADLLAGRDAAIAGVLLALLAATRSNALLLAPVVLLWLWWRSARLGRAPARLAVPMVVGLGVASVPFAAFNAAAQGTPVPFQGAWSFYLGANPAADGTPYARQGLDWQRLESIGYRDGPGATRAQRGRIYLTEGLRFIADTPGAWLRLLYAKLRLFANAFEVPESLDLRYYEGFSRLRRCLPVDFGVVMPLALAGIAANRRRWREWGLLYGGVGAFLLSGLVFTVSARYRLPAVPFLILFAADAVHRAVRLARARDERGGARFALVLAAAVALVHTGVDPARADHLRSDWLQGEVAWRSGDVARAADAFRAALAQDPEDADVHNSLGAACERLGDAAQAEAEYRAALGLAPDHSRAGLNLAALLRRDGRLDEAAAAAQRALAADPRPGIQYEAHVALGEVAAERGDLDGAHRAVAAALAVQDRAQGRYALAGLCHRLGRIDEEVSHLERAVALEPGFAAAQRNLGALYLRRGDLAAAEAALRRAVALEPDAAIGHDHLAALYARTGRPDLARAELEAVARLRAAGQGAP